MTAGEVEASLRMKRKTQATTVNFRNPNVSSSAAEPDEGSFANKAGCTLDKISAPSEERDGGHYENVAVFTEDKVAANKMSSSFTQLFPPLALSWVVLLVIVALRIYFTSVISDNNAKLTAEIQNLTKKNQELWTQNQELERERENLTEQIQTMETGGNELNVSRAQWSVDAYCPRDSHSRQCQSCQRGWITSQSNCYAGHDAQSANRRTWEEAREDCRGKSSDLVVVTDQAEKKFVSEYSWDSGGTSGYWIGLRVEDGRWKWVDGSDLTDDSWIQQSPTNGHCAISVRDQGWKSVRCGSKNRWICKKKALSL